MRYIFGHKETWTSYASTTESRTLPAVGNEIRQSKLQNNADGDFATNPSCCGIWWLCPPIMHQILHLSLATARICSPTACNEHDLSVDYAVILCLSLHVNQQDIHGRKDPSSPHVEGTLHSQPDNATSYQLHLLPTSIPRNLSSSLNLGA